MKILIITNHSYMLYQFRKELIETLLKKHEVVLSMPFAGHEEDFQAMGCKCINTKIDRRGINPLKDLHLIKFYNKLLKEEKPDKVITYSIKPNIYAGLLCAWKKIPYYANVQGLGTAFQKPGLAQFVTLLYKAAFIKVQKVFFENKGNAGEFLKRRIVKKKKIKVLNGAGVNLEHYSYTEYPETNVIHFLYLGRIMEEKGVNELFWAMKRLKKEFGDKVILDIVGFFEEEYKETIEDLVEKSIAKFHGFQKETRPWYGMAHCVVLPSYHEGMSNVLLEASAMGRPVITSNIPGCKEAVDEGKTGFLCQVKDEESLYEKMKEFLLLPDEEKKQMGINARKYMEHYFDKKKVVGQTLKTLELK